MADLKYAWNSGHNSVQMSPDVSLPQFSILGHRQRLIEVSNNVKTEVDTPHPHSGAGYLKLVI